MTGIDTAPMIPSIMSGSLIRATPPCARMSAGTRSSAITATAPASSAILACSGVTTSMITPPLSISAMPRLTRAVPVSGSVPATDDVPVGVASTVDTVENLLVTDVLTSIVCAVLSGGGLHGQSRRTQLGASGARPAGLAQLLVAVGERVVHVEELGPRRAAGQPEHAGQGAAPGVDRCAPATSL